MPEPRSWKEKLNELCQQKGWIDLQIYVNHNTSAATLAVQVSVGLYSDMRPMYGTYSDHAEFLLIEKICKHLFDTIIEIEDWKIKHASS